MHCRKAVILLVTISCISLSAQAQVTNNSTDTPVTVALGAGGSPIASIISFSVSGVITAASTEVAINVGACGTGGPLVLTGPGGGSVTIMSSVNNNAGDIFLIPDLTNGVTCTGACLGGCGSTGAPVHCQPESGVMSVFNTQTSDASNWVLSLSTNGTPTCGPFSINSWSMTLDGAAPLPVEVTDFSID